MSVFLFFLLHLLTYLLCFRTTSCFDFFGRSTEQMDRRCRVSRRGARDRALDKLARLIAATSDWTAT